MTPPFSEDVEYGVIGSMLVHQESIPTYISSLKEEHFYRFEARAYFNAIRHLFDNGVSVSITAIEEAVRRSHKDTYSAILNKYSDMTRQCVYGNEEYYCAILKEYYFKRMIIEKSTQLVQKASQDADADELASMVASMQIDALSENGGAGLTAKEIVERDSEATKYDRVYMNYRFYDETLYKNTGSHKGTVKVIIGHPKHGKTQYALLETCFYLNAGNSVVWYAMEGTDSDVVEAASKQLVGKEHLLENLIVVDSVFEISELAQNLRYWKYKLGDKLKVAVFDYVQKVEVKGLPYHEETKRVVTASDRITKLTKDIGVCSLVLAQPHNLSPHRKGYHCEPDVDDIYGSGQVKKDAFTVLSVFRPNLIEDLRIEDGHSGELLGIKPPDHESKIGNDAIDKPNRVFVRQKLTRKGEPYWKWIRLYQSDKGLRFDTEK